MIDPIVGIDLGTTQSLIGVVDSGFPILLADANGSRLTPSVVHVSENGALTVGAAALRYRSLDPARTITSVKRLIGHRPGEAGWNPPYDLKALGIGPIEVSAAILTHLRGIAETALGHPVRRAVITVPAYFNDAQRGATKQAGEQAGWIVERMVSEPTAVALAYGLDKLEGQRKIAVYDLGGGTFDVSVVELRDGVFEVLATAGDTRLGGDDLDRQLAAWLWRRHAPSDSPTWEQLANTTRARLFHVAEQAKKNLSSQESVTIEEPFLLGSWSLKTVLTVGDLEEIAQPWVEATRRHCLRALSDAGLNANELDEVILAGGSTRMPIVRRKVTEWFGRPPSTSQHPDEAIALGAVIQAGILSGSLRNLLLLDVTPLSLGIETFGGLMNVIIPRNTTLPCKAGEMFTNAVSGQTQMLIRVLQGEREMARDNWELGRVEVPFVAAAKGKARVGVQFSIDANGLLQVLARDTATGIDTVLEVERMAVDVEDERVEQMVSESVEHAFEDMTDRQRTEAVMKSRELLDAVDMALNQLGSLVTSDTEMDIRSHAEKVRKLLDVESPDLTTLQTANQALDDATQELAVILVEQAMEASLQRRGFIE